MASHGGRVRVSRLRGAVQPYVERLEGTVVGRLSSRLLEDEFVDRSVALASKAFVSLFPLMIVCAAMAPPQARVTIVETIAERFGISGEARTVVRQAFATPDQIKSATGLLGAVLTLAFAMSFATALQRVYLKAWRRPAGADVRDKGRGAIWMGGALALAFILTAVQRILAGVTGTVASWLLGLVVSTLLWWWTARLMLRGEVRWRALLPTALVTGIGAWLYTLAAAVWMPVAISQHYAEFGAFGIALAFVTWFTGFAFLVVGAAVLSPVLVEGDDALGRWLRGGRSSALEDGAVPPPPSRRGSPPG